MKDIPGFEGRYLATEAGGIWSVRAGRVLAARRSYRGYWQVKLGAGRLYLVHRLIAAAWCPNPERKPQVNHRDGDPSNNAPANLEWCTQSENMRHAYATGLQSPPSWSAESRARLAASMRLRPPPSDVTKARISAARIGKGRAPKSPEHRAKIGAALRARRAGA